MSIIEAAAFLAQQWPVFACAANKRPVTQHGLKDATQDERTLRAQFRSPNAAMIGVPTGATSGIIAIDLDVKDGAAGLEWLAANEHRLPRTRRHRTQSGGVHLLFQAPAVPIRNSVRKLAPGVDVRGDNGYIIAPPSPGYSITDDAMPAPLPAWLLEALAPSPEPVHAPPRPSRTDGRGTAYALAALSDECDAIMGAGWGTQEHTLNAAALKLGALAAGGEIDPAYAREALISAGLGMPSQPGREPWTPQDVRNKVERAFRDGATRPRAAPARHTHTIRVEIVPPEPPPYDEAPDWALAEPEVYIPQAEAPAQPATALWIDADEWTAEAIPHRPWIATGYLMRGSVSVLSGAGAGGKSSLVVAWSIALATGTDLGTFSPKAAVKVLNYNVEDDCDEQRRRYSAALLARKMTGADIVGRIIRCGPHDIGTLFERDQNTGRVYPTANMVALEQLLIDSGAQVAICDPLAELHNAEENDNNAMRAVVAAFRSLARRLGIAVLILHHDRKGNSTPGDMDRMRGASSISGAVRVALTLSTMSQEEADRHGIPPEERRAHFRIDGAKSNYAPAQDAEWWRLAGYQIPNGETVAACLPWTPPGMFDGVSMADSIRLLEFIARGIDGCPYGSANAARRELADAMTAAFPHLRLTRERIKGFLAAWLDSGAISEEPDQRSPNSRHKRTGFVVDSATVSQMRQTVGEF